MYAKHPAMTITLGGAAISSPKETGKTVRSATMKTTPIPAVAASVEMKTTW